MDKDGKISYKDFYNSIGLELYPQEGLYFRQEKLKAIKIITCKTNMCFNPTQNNTHFCNVHQKMQVDKAIQIFGVMNSQIKT